MYNTSGATLRGDLNAVVEQGSAADKWFIGAQVLPPTLVAAKSGQYPILKLAAAELLSQGATLRAPGGKYGEAVRAWDSATYDCLDRGLEEAVDDVVAKDLGRYFNVEATKARLCLRNVMLDHEVRAAAEIMSTGNFGSATNSVVAYTAANVATISFVADILAAIERVNDNGGQANTIVLSSTVLNRVKLGTLVQNFLRGSLPSDATLNVTANSIAAAFADNGITQCLVGRARINSAKKGQAYSASSVWGNTYIWVGDVRAGDPGLGGAGRTLVWNEDGGLFSTETYRDESRRSNMVRVRQNTDEVIVDSTAGTLIATQYS
jgi:hypothetical protein